MTREEKLAWLESLPGEMISPAQLAVVTGGDRYTYNCAAREGKLNLPYEWHGIPVSALRKLKDSVMWSIQ